MAESEDRTNLTEEPKNTASTDNPTFTSLIEPTEQLEEMVQAAVLGGKSRDNDYSEGLEDEEDLDTRSQASSDLFPLEGSRLAVPWPHSPGMSSLADELDRAEGDTTDDEYEEVDEEEKEPEVRGNQSVEWTRLTEPQWPASVIEFESKKQADNLMKSARAAMKDLKAMVLEKTATYKQNYREQQEKSDGFGKVIEQFSAQTEHAEQIIKNSKAEHKAKIAKYEAEVSNLRQRIEEASLNGGPMTPQANDAQESLNRKEVEVKEQQEIIEKLKTEKAEVQSALAQRTQDIEGHENTQTLLRNSLGTEQNANKDLKNRVTNMESELGRLRAHNKQLGKEVTDHEKAIKTLQDMNETLTKSLDRAEASGAIPPADAEDIDAKIIEIQDLKDRVLVQDETIEKRNAQLLKLNEAGGDASIEKVKELEEQIAEFQKYTDEQREDIDKLQKENEVLKSRTELNTKTTTYRRNQDSLIEELETKVAELERRLRKEVEVERVHEETREKRSLVNKRLVIEMMIFRCQQILIGKLIAPDQYVGKSEAIEVAQAASQKAANIQDQILEGQARFWAGVASYKNQDLKGAETIFKECWNYHGWKEKRHLQNWFDACRHSREVVET